MADGDERVAGADAARGDSGTALTAGAPARADGAAVRPGDLLVTVLARAFVAAASDGMRVLAITLPESLLAGLAARRLGAPDLALATGFAVLDAIDPVASLSRGEAALGFATAHVAPSSDTFVAVARGIVGVCTTPAQLDARGAVNLSGIGGTPERPRVALPGSRGLPDNNDMAGPVWYVLPTHSPRTLVDRVDVVSGVPPTPGRSRRLVTPAGTFDLGEQGWVAASLHPGTRPAMVREATGFAIAGLDDAPTTPAPTVAELAAIEAVDPHGLRHLPTMAPHDRADAIDRIVAIESEATP